MTAGVRVDYQLEQVNSLQLDNSITNTAAQPSPSTMVLDSLMKRFWIGIVFVGASLFLTGCGGLGAKRQILQNNYFSADEQTRELIEREVRFAQNLSPAEVISLDGYVRAYLSKKGRKAMYGAFPLSCNYRYYWSNANEVKYAMQQAKRECQIRANAKNKVLGTSCNCRIVAYENTLLYPNDVYQGMHSIIPMIAQVTDNAGGKSELSGVIEVIDTGSEMSPIVVKSKQGDTLCRGRYDIRKRAKGRIELSCFNSSISGKGSFVNTGFNEELRVPYGSAQLSMDDGTLLQIIYGAAGQNR